MTSTLEVESTLTDSYLATVPEAVRHALQLGKGDKVLSTIRPNGEVVLSRVGAPENDSVTGDFLSFLANDIVNRPHHLHALDVGLVIHLQSLVEGIDVDLNAPLAAKDE